MVMPMVMKWIQVWSQNSLGIVPYFSDVAFRKVYLPFRVSLL